MQSVIEARGFIIVKEPLPGGCLWNARFISFFKYQAVIALESHALRFDNQQRSSLSP
jgi:hypothetical protein